MKTMNEKYHITKLAIEKPERPKDPAYISLFNIIKKGEIIRRKWHMKK